MRRDIFRRALLIAAILAVFAPGSAMSGKVPFLPWLSPEKYPVIDGSTSTQPLGALMACRLTRTAFAWGKAPSDSTRRLYPTTDRYNPFLRLSLDFHKRWVDKPKDVHPVLAARIQHHGTHQSYVNLIAGSASLILVAREPSEDELKMAKDKGVHIHWKPVALDAFVFIANVNNPVKTLTVEQIRSVYTGAITNWEQVGGHSKRLRAYQRNRNSGSQEMMEKLVMKELKMIAPVNLERPSMFGPFNVIRGDENGLGYTVYYYHTHMNNHTPQVKLMAVNGIEPSSQNFQNRKYPFVSEVFIAWVDELPKGGMAEVVRDWILSEAGQQLVEESGYTRIR